MSQKVHDSSKILLKITEFTSTFSSTWINNLSARRWPILCFIRPDFFVCLFDEKDILVFVWRIEAKTNNIQRSDDTHSNLQPWKHSLLI